MRKPIASDRFYVGDPDGLRVQVNGFLGEVSNLGVKVAICPHASYLYGGKCAGSVYSKMQGECDVVIIIGPNHFERGSKISFSFQNFLTPLGKVGVNLSLANEILSRSKMVGLDSLEDEDSHNVEHSLEVQLPFIQTLFPNATIVPILLGDLTYEESIKLSQIIYYCSKNRKVKVVISSDFSHYGEVYQFTPFYDNIRERLINLDLVAVEYILNAESKSFYDYAVLETTICGIPGVVVGVELAKLFSCPHAENVSFFSSGDFSGDYSVCVNYGGIIFS